MLALGPRPRAGQPRPCLDRALIIPERWDVGIGGMTLNAALAEAKRRHYSRVHLWTHEDNERSHRLYRSRGFAPTGRIADGEGEWARTLTKWFASPHSSVVGDVRLPRSAQTGSL
jgi:GNAT superfamily N-acetyltransferase